MYRSQIVLAMVGNLLPTMLVFGFSPLCAAEERTQAIVDLGEHCSSPERRRREVELRSPACWWLIEGSRRAANGGRLLLVTFLGKTRKVTSCRSTAGGFDFCFNWIPVATGMTGYFTCPLSILIPTIWHCMAFNSVLGLSDYFPSQSLPSVRKSQVLPPSVSAVPG